METESRYLKKIRDVIHKKNTGSGSGTIYSGPNTKAKYLHDIAEEVDKLDIGGGGSTYESPFFVATVGYSVGSAYMIQSIQQMEDAISNGKIIYLKYGNKVLSYRETKKINNVDYYVFDSIPSYQIDEPNNTIAFRTTILNVSKTDKSIIGDDYVTTAYVNDVSTLVMPITF